MTLELILQGFMYKNETAALFARANLNAVGEVVKQLPMCLDSGMSLCLLNISGSGHRFQYNML